MATKIAGLGLQFGLLCSPLGSQDSTVSFSTPDSSSQEDDDLEGSISVPARCIKLHKVNLARKPSDPEPCYIKHIRTGLYLYRNSSEKCLEMRPLMKDERHHYEFQHCKYYGFDDTRNNMAVVVSDFWTTAEQQEMLECITANKVHNVDLKTKSPVSPNTRFLSDQDDRWFVGEFVNHNGFVFESLKVRGSYLVVADGEIRLKALDKNNINNEKDAIFWIHQNLDTCT